MINGIRLAAVAAGIKTNGDSDLVLLEAAAGSSLAAVFTRNQFCAPPVTLAKQHLASTDASDPVYCLINAGNANAGTGEAGMANAMASCKAVSAVSGVGVSQVLPFSTGVIGEQLPLDKVVNAIPGLFAALSADAWDGAANAIMTTDTQAKHVQRSIVVNDKPVEIAGIAKGAGMIKPNMATTLSYVATDAAIAPSLLQATLADLTDLTFNCITVDGDTSTNDACVLIATGQAQAPQYHDGSEAGWETLRAGLHAVLLELALEIVRDAEGASKLVAVTVRGARGRDDALQVAYTVAESPLVKTALYAADPNWGRILAAVGRAGIALDIDAVSIRLDDTLIAERGAVAATYVEAAAQKVMDKSEFSVVIDLGSGDTEATVWTCDLSHDYVTINAEYRT